MVKENISFCGRPLKKGMRVWWRDTSYDWTLDDNTQVFNMYGGYFCGLNTYHEKREGDTHKWYYLCEACAKRAGIEW